MPINKSLLNNIPKSINTSPVIQNASFSLLPVNNQSRSLKQPLGNLNINQLVPEEPKPSTQDDSNFLASLIGQSAAMLGAGIRGGNLSDVAQNFQEMRDRRERQKEQEDLAKKYTDPNSEESKKRRLVYKSALGIDIPENYSYTDLNDPIVLQSIKDKSAEMKYAQMPKQVGTVPTGAKTEKEKSIKIEQKDIDEMGRINELRNLTNDLNQSIKQYGNKWFGGEAKNQDTLKYNIAATMGVLKDQGAMTESDINFWTKSLEKATSESSDDYSKRLNNLQKNLINKQINKLENKGYHVETKGNKYYVYTKDGLDPIAEF